MSIADPLLLFSDAKSVYLLDPRNPRPQPRDVATLVNGLKDVHAVDYLYEDDVIVWGSVQKNFIQQASLPQKPDQVSVVL